MSCERVKAALEARDRDAASAGAGAEAGPELLAHLEACPRCRRQALEADPSLLFALAASAERSRSETESARASLEATGPRTQAAEPDWRGLSDGTGLNEAMAQEYWQAAAAPGATDAPQPDWTGFNERVRVAIAEEERRAGVLGRILDSGVLAPRRLTAAAAIAAVAVLATIAGRQGWEKAHPPTPYRAEAPTQPPAPGIVAALPGLPSPMAPAMLSAPPPVEGVDSPTARVVHLALGETAPGTSGAAGAPGAGDTEPSDVVLILDETMDL